MTDFASPHEVANPAFLGDWDLLCDDREAGRLRACVSGQLSRLRLVRLTDDLSVVAGELAANAIRYGGGPVRATLLLTPSRDAGAGLRLEVDDAGPGFDVDRVVATWEDAEAMYERCSGRGLLIVSQLCRAWGSEWRGSRHVVWAEVGLEPEAADEGASLC
ncbi:ATP-binding protein [Streptomyces parvus]|uniref:ATP-binding protein n=1 Tax=Streptomyces parvus TaxID=66428 RepID=UPI00341A7060